MDNRQYLLDLLEVFRPYDANEQMAREEIYAFVKTNPDCFENNHLPGHITGAALVTDKSRKYVLLTHHTQLNLWLQFGGHSDGHWNPLETAWREAQEESGLTSLAHIPGHEGIFDVDTHVIPVYKNMPEHTHYDVRILLQADRGEPYHVSNESHDLAWVPVDEVHTYNTDPSLLRMVEKLKNM